MSNVIELNDRNFDSEILNSDIPVAVDFWAQWCGPCRTLTPIMEDASVELNGAVKVCKLNVDDSPATAQKYGVMSIPTVIVFKDGKIVDQMVGVQPKQMLVDRLKKAA